jgi:hypothetical protein
MEKSGFLKSWLTLELCVTKGNSTEQVGTAKYIKPVICGFAEAVSSRLLDLSVPSTPVKKKSRWSRRGSPLHARTLHLQQVEILYTLFSGTHTNLTAIK